MLIILEKSGQQSFKTVPQDENREFLYIVYFFMAERDIKTKRELIEIDTFSLIDFSI